MKSKQPSNGTIFGGLILLVLSSATLVQGQAVLVDFGNASSFRGATQTGADANGNYWTSIYSGAYYSNLADLSSSATTWGIGFNASTGLNTDSYNGPSGGVDNSIPGDPTNPPSQAFINQANINAAALGILGGSKAAAFDYYTATDGRFVVQGLNSNETYNLSFFGSHKYSAVNTTDYGVYTDSTYATAVSSTTLNVGIGGANNTSTVATLANLTAQAGNQIFVRFGASGFTANGYLNELAIVGFVPYTAGGSVTLSAAKTYPGNTILGNSTTVDANFAGALGGGTSALELGAGGGVLNLAANQSVAALIGAGNLALTTGSNTLTLVGATTATFNVGGGAVAANDYTGILSGSGLISKTGTGSQTLSGANTFSGTFRVSAGTLNLNNVNALPSATLDTSYGGTGTITFAVAGTNTYNVAGLVGNRPVDLGGNTLEVTANTPCFYDGGVGGGGSLIKSGAATVTLRGTNTLTGSLTIAAGTLQISDDGPAGGGTIGTTSGITNNGGLAYFLTNNARTYANSISGSGWLTKTGTNTLTLSGINSYTGDTTVNGGTLVLADAAQLKFKPTTNHLTNSIHGTATVALDGVFNVDLTGAAIADGNSWVLVNVTTLSESFGTTFRVDGFSKGSHVWTKVDGANTWTFTEATGVLSLAVASTANYASWAIDNGITGQPAEGDYDHDGLTNLTEYALGLDPKVSSQPVGAVSNGGKTITFTKGLAAKTNLDVSYAIETSTDLGISPNPWTVATSPVMSETADTIAITFPDGPLRNFARLKVTQP
ncbi:MAG: autotransporter-associated beta strand repeat-containing protein [Verrucomicrobiota bacterium]